MNKKVDVLGVLVNSIKMEDALVMLNSFLKEDRIHIVFTPNSEIMMEAQRDPSLKEVLNSADLLVPDGAGVVLASFILGNKLPQKLPGFDLIKKSFEFDFDRKVSYFFFGSKPGIAEAAASNIKRNYPGTKIVGTRSGYFSEDEETALIESINASKADILLVALGAPKQEKWIYYNAHRLNVKICIGVGGSLDVLAGSAVLAPHFLRKNGLEWLYRLYREPSRYKRMMDLPRYTILAVKNRLGIKPRSK